MVRRGVGGKQLRMKEEEVWVGVPGQGRGWGWNQVEHEG